jgi:hypothetical protein
MSNTDLFELVGDLAHDLREGGYTQAELQRVCQEEASQFNVSSADLQRKVQAAYVSKYIYKDEQ